ncbi:MAG: UPF0058 family protein [Halobacteria archaeon]|nr:UPF0058 family protein [Halobacteria archaeon]
MQKNELIHLHSLLVQIKKHVQEREDVDEDQFESYADLETRPVHIHKSKSAHKEAIFVLGEEITEIMDGDENEAGIESRTKEIVNKASS